MNAGWQHHRGWRFLSAGGGFLLLALAYMPILWLMVLSFSERPLSAIPFPLTLGWYEQMLADTRWRQPMWTSCWLALGVGALSAILAAAVGRSILRLNRPGRVIALALMPLFVPGLTIGAAQFLFFRIFLGLRLGIWSVFIGHLFWALPFALVLTLVIYSRFDRVLLDAAADLGAGPWQRFRLVEWPFLRPAFFGAGLFGFLLSFNELPRTLFLRGTTTTMPVFQWAQAADHQSYVPISFALATIVVAVTVPVLIGFFRIAFRQDDRS
ncbi:MAG: ABC transporter permease subunit [Rhizobiales bacterium]|nr:ABC transporter permease subunit [Hyphomicrobiales bacterium]